MTKTWAVFNKLTGFVGYVRASRKYVAMALAERDLHQRPGNFYLGVAD